MTKSAIIRKAEKSDFKALYALGEITPEFQVSATEDFMSEDEFRTAMKSSKSVFLLAEINKKIIGFILANAGDIEKEHTNKWACLVYLTVLKKFRNQGIATQLYEACIKKLKEMGISQLYGWANTEGDGAIIKFLEIKGFARGHLYRWMDKAI